MPTTGDTAWYAAVTRPRRVARTEETQVTIKDEVLAVLEELGGEVTDPDGYAVRRVFERIASTANFTAVSGAVGELDKAGLVVRDMPTLKTTTRIALNRPGVRPGRKALVVVMEQVSRLMAATLETELQTVIDAHVEAGMMENGVHPDDVADLRDRLAAAEQRVRAQSASIAELRAEPARLRERLAEVEAALAEEREARANAERALESWKRKALGKAAVRETLIEIRDLVDPAAVAEIDRIMRELPRGRQ